MERLLVLTLEASGCEAEAWLNGIPLAKADAGRPRLALPVHEYALAGNNRLELVVGPRPAGLPQQLPAAPLSLVADGKSSAQLRILLPRAGNPVDEASARVLAHIDWAPPASQAYQVPFSQSQDIALPVSFPRWRWRDAPVVDATPALQQQAGALLTRLGQELSQGQTDGFIAATRLRNEELAAAYQVTHDEVLGRLREHLTALSAAGPLAWVPLPPEGPLLRRVADGRLFECLDAKGEPALRTVPDASGTIHFFPMRFAAVEGKLYVLR